jgi:predicted DNA-binding protein
MGKYVLTNVRFTKEEHEALKHLALRENRSMANIVREAVSSYITREEGRTLTEEELAKDPFFGVVGIGCSETENTLEDHDKALYGENLGNSQETQRDVGTKE